MQILWRGWGATPGPQPQLDYWERQPFAVGTEAGPRAGDHRDSYLREVGREAPGPPEPAGIHRKLANYVGSYKIFPPRLVSGVLRRPAVLVGDTVGILYHAPAGIDLFFGARVTQCFDQEEAGWWRSGFTYRTLRGHPELGEETFAVEKNLTTGAVRVSLQSWSRPGTWLAAVFAPVVRQLQVGASHSALDHLSVAAVD